MASERTVEERLDALESRPVRLNPTSASQCTAEMPHGELRFMRGPNVYACPCGKTYVKNGPVLREE